MGEGEGGTGVRGEHPSSVQGIWGVCLGVMGEGRDEGEWGCCCGGVRCGNVADGACVRKGDAVGVCRGEMNGEGVEGGEANLEHVGEGEYGLSAFRLQGRVVPPVQMMVSGVLLLLHTLMLHTLQRSTFALQRSMPKGKPCTCECRGVYECWCVFECWGKCGNWGVWERMCWNGCVSGAVCVCWLALRRRSSRAQAGSLRWGGPVDMSTSMELLERE